MARYGMLINTKKCIGCYACRTACQRQNDLLPDESFIRFEEREVGKYPNVTVEHIPLQCMHCEDAPCAAVCPTHATYTTDSGVVLVNEEKCIGCNRCMEACMIDVMTPGEKGSHPVVSYPDECWYCGCCVMECPTGAISLHHPLMNQTRWVEKASLLKNRKEN